MSFALGCQACHGTYTVSLIRRPAALALRMLEKSAELKVAHGDPFSSLTRHPIVLRDGTALFSRFILFSSQWERVREFSIAVNGTSGRSRDNVCPIDLQY